MRALYALYADGHAAQKAVDSLRTAGVADNDITVISAQPMDDFEFSHMGGRSYMWFIACAGGLMGFAFATWLARLTQTSWMIQTGGMPIVSWWPNLIIMFEVTMLGAILASVITLVVTARLGRRRPALYDSEVADGKILVGIENPHAASLSALQEALRISASTELKTL